MAARPTWKGYLKISLVNIPIKVFPATDAGATLSFNQLHAECQTRIQQKRWCPHCQREVANTDLVKGYERSEEHTSELQSRRDLVCRLLLEKKKKNKNKIHKKKE